MLFNKAGDTLVEILVSIGILAIGAVSLVFLLVNGFQGSWYAQDELRAMGVMRETWEATQSLTNAGYNTLVAGTYGLSKSGGSWVFSGVSDVVNGVTRSVTVGPVTRDGSGNIAGSGTADVQTRKITTNLSWLSHGTPKTATQVNYVTNHDSARFFEDTTADFSDGTFSQTQGYTDVDSDGAVGLEAIPPGFWECAETEGVFDDAGTATANDVAVSGSYAYVVTNIDGTAGEFLVFDITDTKNPVQVASLDLATSATAVAVSGSFAYVTSILNAQELIVVNITTPSAPTVAGTLDLTGVQNANDIVVSGSYAYIVRDNIAGGNELAVVNITTPASPSLASSLDLGGGGNGIQISGSYVYVATTVDAAELRVVSISNPLLPSIVGSADLSGTTDANEVDVFGTKAYLVKAVNAAGNEFFVVDVSTPSSPTVSGSLDLGNAGLVVKMDGTTAMIGTDVAARSLQIVDAATASAPVLMATLDVSNSAFNGLAWTGSRLFVATSDTSNELQIERFSTTSTWGCMERKSTIDLPNATSATAVYTSGTTLYAVTTSNTGSEFFVYNVATPASPVLIGSLNLGATANDVIVSGNYAYIASTTNNQELRVIDISTPSAPVQVGSYNAAGNTDATGVSISGTKVLLVQGSTFYHINVATPASPALLGSVALAGVGSRVRLYNSTYAFVATAGNSAEVQTVNISANTPSIAGSFDATGTADGKSLWVKGTSLYLATDVNAGGGEFYTLDVSTPTAPTQTNTLEIGAASFGVAADSDETFVFAGNNATHKNVVSINTSVPSTPSRKNIVTTLNGNVNDISTFDDVMVVGTASGTQELVIYGKVPAVLAGGGYKTTGTYISSIFDAGATAIWNTIEWTESTGCATGDIQLQIRTATTSGGLASELWQGVDGEDGDSTDFFTDPLGTLIHISHNADRYVQYMASLSSDGTCTPQIKDVTLTEMTY